MELKRKIGNLLVAGFQGYEMNDQLKSLIHDYYVGSLILFSRNLKSPEQIYQLTTDIQNEAKKAGHKYPILICIDQEYGVVKRLGEETITLPGAMLLGATNDPQLANKTGYYTGQQLKQLGINWNLAPVVDVNNNPANPVIGVRSFGEDPNHVTKFAKQQMLGMQQAGVMTCLKHFPGHGDTHTDSHLDLPIIEHDMERLNKVELVPFKQLIKEGADAIMSAHVYFPALEPQANKPATLSKNIITTLLRKQLNFDGIITTDCMEMDAISETIGTVEGCLQAVIAGVDMVMVSHTYEWQIGAMEKIEQAIKNGQLSMEQIDESVARIERLKRKYTNTQHVVPFTDSQLKEIEHEIEIIYQKGITEQHGNGDAVQLDETVLLILPTTNTGSKVEDVKSSAISLWNYLKIHHEKTQLYLLNYKEETMQSLLTYSKEFNRVIAVCINAQKNIDEQNFLHKLSKQQKVDIVTVRSPYDAAHFKEANRVICCYEMSDPALKIVASALLGKCDVTGQYPVTI